MQNNKPVMPKTVIVTGATGQDGSYMIEYLLKRTEHTVIAGIRRTSQAILSNLQNVIHHPRLRLVTMDLCDVHAINRLVQEQKPDYFLNFGASTFVPDSWEHPGYTMEVNATALIHILEAIRRHAPRCRVYSAGSSEQWGDVKYTPQDEKHPMSPRSIYGVSKCAASHICKVYRESYGLYVVHGLLLNHESERRQRHFVSRKISTEVARIYHSLRQGAFEVEPLRLGNIHATRDWSHAEDFVDGIWRMLHQERHRPDLGSGGKPSSNGELAGQLKEYVLSSNEKHTVKEFVELAFSEAGFYNCHWEGEGVNEAYHCCGLASREDQHHSLVGGREPQPLVKIDPRFYRPADVTSLCGDSSMAREELQWQPRVGFKELVRRMVWHDINHCDAARGDAGGFTRQLHEAVPA